MAARYSASVITVALFLAVLQVDAHPLSRVKRSCTSNDFWKPECMWMSNQFTREPTTPGPTTLPPTFPPNGPSVFNEAPDNNEEESEHAEEDNDQSVEDVQDENQDEGGNKNQGYVGLFLPIQPEHGCNLPNGKFCALCNLKIKNINDRRRYIARSGAGKGRKL